jgi:hypothetical protein
MELDQSTLVKFQELIEVNFTGRAELYAAADSLEDKARQQVCRRLADHLAAGHAVELQQLLTACGVHPTEPFDVYKLVSTTPEARCLTRLPGGLGLCVVAGLLGFKDCNKRPPDTSNGIVCHSLSICPVAGTSCRRSPSQGGGSTPARNSAHSSRGVRAR